MLIVVCEGKRAYNKVPPPLHTALSVVSVVQWMSQLPHIWTYAANINYTVPHIEFLVAVGRF